MALTSASFSWRRRSLVVSRTGRVMFGREFITIILRNLPSIQPALRDVNRNSGRDPYPKISVKNYMSAKIRGGRLGLRSGWLSSRLIPHRHCPRTELQPAHELQVDWLRQSREQRRPMARDPGLHNE